MKNYDRNIIVGISTGLVATFLWSCFPAFIKIALQTTSVPLFLLLRYAASTLLLSPFAKNTFKKIKQLPCNLWIYVFTTTVLNNGTQALCLKAVPVTWYILFFSCSPMLTLLLLPGKRSRVTYFCFLFSIVGTIVFLNPENISNYPSYSAIFYLFICIGSWAILVKLMTDLHKVYNDMEITYVLNMCNLISAAFLFVSNGLHWSIDMSWMCLLSIIFLSVFSPLSSYFFSLSVRLMPSFGIASQYLVLIFGFLIGYSIFNEIPTQAQCVGSAIIVTSLIVITYSSIRNRVPKLSNVPVFANKNSRKSA